jgi:hypothetical protein
MLGPMDTALLLHLEIKELYIRPEKAAIAAIKAKSKISTSLDVDKAPVL